MSCRVTPRARRSAIKGERMGALLVAIKAPPVDGKANEELISFLSKLTGIAKSRISIIKGLSGREKTLLFHNVKEEQLTFEASSD